MRRLALLALAAWLGMLSGPAAGGEFYLRGGVGIDRPDKASFTDVDCATTAPAALYGCGTGADGEPYRSSGDFGTVPAVEFGLGYATEGRWRFEALVEYRPRFTFRGEANFLPQGRRQSVSAELRALSGMVAGYFDFAPRAARAPGRIAPYVGAGAGPAHVRIGQTVMNFPQTVTNAPGGSRLNLAWMATAGVAVALDDRVSVDLAWRYTDLGRVRAAGGDGRVTWRDGSREPRPLDLAPTRSRLQGHGLRLSLRYAL